MATEFEIKLRAGNVRQLEKILKDPQVAGRALEKLRELSDADYEQLELIPDFMD